VRPLVSMREALADPALLGSILPGPSWSTWRTLLIATFGEELTEDERVVFRQLTGREEEPGELVEEALWLIGRRGGKTRAMATACAYIAGLCDHSDVLALGERGVLPFLARDQKQAAVAFGYAAAIFETVPHLRGLVVNRTTDSLSLSTRVDLEVRPANWRGVRGLTAVAGALDEVCFWESQEGAANADTAIFQALRPALATTGGPILVVTSPHARRGEAWTLFKRHFGPAGDRRILVVQAPSRTLNPSLPQAVVDRALERDASAAAAEYLAQWRTDVEMLLTIEAVEACVDVGVVERPRIDGVSYLAFVDPSGGSADSMTLAIGHAEDGAAVIDALRERRPPFSPESVVAEFAQVLKSYGLASVRGDKYGGAWPSERFAKHGIEYRPARAAKSELYAGFVSVVNSGRLALVDSPRLVAQLCGLERRTARGGRDSIDHAPGAHDDLANVVAGLAHLALIRPAFEHEPPAFGPIIFQRGQVVGSAPEPPGYEDSEDDYGRQFERLGAF
jgi:hypothetical protein